MSGGGKRREGDLIFHSCGCLMTTFAFGKSRTWIYWRSRFARPAAIWLIRIMPFHGWRRGTDIWYGGRVISPSVYERIRAKGRDDEDFYCLIMKNVAIAKRLYRETLSRSLRGLARIIALQSANRRLPPLTFRRYFYLITWLMQIN